jgi:hypothetical protein
MDRGSFWLSDEQFARLKPHLPSDTRGKPRVDAGKEYGPFHDFACAAWPMVFGSEKGLGHAIKTWASGRAQHREKSPFIRNLALRHPEWRIRER